jgi:hypothetical protein
MLVCLLVATCCATRLITELKADTGKGGITREERWRRIDPSETQISSATTKAVVAGNAVLVPVAIVHKRSEVHVLLLLDTGSSRTVVST